MKFINLNLKIFFIETIISVHKIFMIRYGLNNNILKIYIFLNFYIT